MSSTPLPAFLSRARLVTAVVSVIFLLLLGILLLGWFAGSRSNTASAPGSTAAQGSPWVQSSGLVLSEVSDLDLLRSQGWTLPLAGLPGYEVVSLSEDTVAGQPAVRMQLQDPLGRDVRITEQRGRIDQDHPTDGIAGLPATTTGLDSAILQGAPVRVRAGSPWRAQIVHADVVYTLQSESSAAEMVRLMHHTEAADRATLALRAEEASSVGETVISGWRRMLGMGP